MYSNKLSNLFNKICNKNSQKIAIQYDKKKITYKKLDFYSDKYKNFFLNKINNKNVIIFIEGKKNIETYYSILGAIKSPFTYSVIDPKIPIDRFKKLIKKNNYILLYSSSKFEGIKSIKKFKIQKILKINFIKNNKKINFYKKNTYIIYTSGSTGNPKGCCVGEDSIISFINYWHKILKIKKNKQKNFSQLNPLYFDNSIFDFYVSIFTGSILSIIKVDNVNEIMNIPSKVLKSNCDIWFSVPSLLIYLINLRLIKSYHLKKIKYVIFGGEGFPKNKLKELWKLKKKFLINVYGPSECTCICSYHYISKKDIFDDKEKFVPLGKITENFNYKILGINKKKSGELALFGKGVGNGYFQNKKETNNNFILKNKKTIGYKTGDLVKIKNKKLYFVGRKDNQIKLMGHRIELEEIEKEINKINLIKENIVIKDDDKNIQKLIAHIYYLGNLKIEDIQRILSKKLPNYMLPKEFFLNDKPLKKNRNFKIDRNYYQNLVLK